MLSEKVGTVADGRRQNPSTERVAGQLCCSTEAMLVGPLVQW